MTKSEQARLWAWRVRVVREATIRNRRLSLFQSDLPDAPTIILRSVGAAQAFPPFRQRFAAPAAPAVRHLSERHQRATATTCQPSRKHPGRLDRGQVKAVSPRGWTKRRGAP